MKKILVTYDISDSTRRMKLINICLDYGLERIQKSVFVGELKSSWIKMFIAEFENLELKRITADIRIFEIIKNPLMSIQNPSINSRSRD